MTAAPTPAIRAALDEAVTAKHAAEQAYLERANQTGVFDQRALDEAGSSAAVAAFLRALPPNWPTHTLAEQVERAARGGER